MSAAAAQRVVLRRSMRGVWPQLPLLLLGSVAICTAAGLTALVTPGATPLSVLVLAVLVTPAVVALCAVANAVVCQDDAGLAVWASGWRTGVRRGYAAALPAAVCGLLFLVAVEVWRQTDQPMLLVSVAVSGAVTLSMVPLTGAMAHAVSALPHLSVREQWRASAGYVLRWPVRFVAAPVLLGFGVWLATQLSVGLLLLVPGPVALVSAAAFWTSAVESGDLSIETFTENDALGRESA